MTSLPDDILEQARSWRAAGKGAALAWVVDTWGSAPRPAGSLAAVSSTAEIAGSVSGGCVEGAVAMEAMEAMEDGRSRLLEYGVSDGDAFAVGLACGGTIRVWVEPIGVGDGPSDDLITALTSRRAQRKQTVYAVDLETRDRGLLGTDAADLDPAAQTALTADRSGVTPDTQRFLAVHNPPLRLAIVGAAHIAQTLVPMARLTGFDCLVIDPREAFATAARFPLAALTHNDPDKALAAYGLDPRVAVVCLTHDPKLDDPALEAALRSDVFYIGALGSKKTHASRCARLTAKGFSDADISRIHGPIGLDIGAKSPAEIAAAILAQLILRLRKPTENPA